MNSVLSFFGYSARFPDKEDRADLTLEKDQGKKESGRWRQGSAQRL